MLNQRILHLRKSMGMTQEELGEKVGVIKQTISSWEKDSSSPSHEIIRKLSEIFDVSTDYLLGVTDDPTTKKSSHELDSREDFRRLLIKERILPEDGMVSEDDKNAILAFAEAYFKRGNK